MKGGFFSNLSEKPSRELHIQNVTKQSVRKSRGNEGQDDAGGPAMLLGNLEEQQKDHERRWNESHDLQDQGVDKEGNENKEDRSPLPPREESRTSARALGIDGLNNAGCSVNQKGELIFPDD